MNVTTTTAKGLQIGSRARRVSIDACATIENVNTTIDNFKNTLKKQ